MGYLHENAQVRIYQGVGALAQPQMQKGPIRAIQDFAQSFSQSRTSLNQRFMWQLTISKKCIFSSQKLLILACTLLTPFFQEVEVTDCSLTTALSLPLNNADNFSISSMDCSILLSMLLTSSISILFCTIEIGLANFSTILISYNICSLSQMIRKFQ